ncbi:MAG: Membrane protein, 6-pyruvoyl-tetrahydropterin synthase-related domain protein [Candidatus Gottesmanbacteria bacterium GW2011_GWB1_49_7]|uniref:Membrane protein, 6-pyruvoyl-tetrahydropterin synthase-related domain protein n=1 Tax=Candidatus Gottesmanbacteria bacterium GW2011_GWB1_49_7 TaxID=1618448 RepID=A0A0G1VYZ1_9BACT|nr:MAG: Membrane protein, 6-pyruvoyl-tetrahydropterin synthase-related domain protein [Microgenomates group bacterium GW2011_GWC1_49_7]KKW11671.1 MAG: Membrane protein, 6-pyruvoyl-tetrahydropterin synthase-related domain protein [Candidatus Gottesmanbacteria bacterium GW2011_GWB1_49_7]
MKSDNRFVLWLSVSVLLIGIILLVSPLLQKGFFISDDGEWMIIRLSAFYQSLREGQFPVRFLGRLNFSYGYPVANFLYPGFMYVGSLLYFLGFTFVDSVKIILGGSVAAGALFTFLWLRTYFPPVASAMGTFGFISTPYLAFDLYKRGSVGEVLAFVPAAMGLYSISAKKPWLLGLAVPLLIVSHNSIALMFLGFIALYITLLGAWRRYWLMFGLGVGMATFFWFPALHDRKYVVFDAMTVANPMAYFITVKNAALVGYAGLLAALLSLFGGKKNRREKTFFVVTFLLTLFIVLPASSFIWNSSILSRLIQFPYRFLSLTVFLGAWLTAYVLTMQKGLVQLVLLCLFAGLGFAAILPFVGQVHIVNRPEGFYTTNEATTTVQGEYMPRWVSQKPTSHAKDRMIFYTGQGQFDPRHVSLQSIDTVVKAAENSEVQVNSVYYPGWGATLDGEKVRIHYDNPLGVMRIQVPQGDHHLIVAFRETISRFLADIVSLVSLIWYVIVVAWRQKKIVRKHS